MDIYAERIKPLFVRSGKSDAELEREIGIPAKKISQWNINYTKSYTKYIQQIAAYFHVSTDYLLGNTDDPSAGIKKETTELLDDLKNFSVLYKKLTEENKKKADEYIALLLGSQK